MKKFIILAIIGSVLIGIGFGILMFDVVTRGYSFSNIFGSVYSQWQNWQVEFR